MDPKLKTIARVHLHHAGHFVIAQIDENDSSAPQEVRFGVTEPNTDKPRRISREDAALLVQMTAVAYPPITPAERS